MKTAAVILAKTIYFLVIVTAGIILGAIASGNLTGESATIAGIIAVVVLALSLSLFLSSHTWEGEADSSRQKKEDKKIS